MTGPQKAGFKDEAGMGNLRPPDERQAAADRVNLEALEREDKGELSALEGAILAIDDLIFVKLHASWSTMTRVAEVLQFRKPLKQVRTLSYTLKIRLISFHQAKLGIKSNTRNFTKIFSDSLATGKLKSCQF